MNNNDIVRDFISEIGQVRTLFREEEIYLAKINRLKNIEGSISPVKNGISFFLDADFAEVVKRGETAIGLSITLLCTDAGWKLEDYIHYPGGEIDWFEYQDSKEHYKDIADLLNAFPKFVKVALSKYRKIVESA